MLMMPKVNQAPLYLPLSQHLYSCKTGAIYLGVNFGDIIKKIGDVNS